MPQPAISQGSTRRTAGGTIDPGGLQREVLTRLIQLIEQEGLRIGDRLPPEVVLAERLGVGRSTIREVLTSWQSMGMVIRNKGAGTRLATEISSRSIQMPVTLTLEAESLIRTHAVRRPLEIEAVRLAALNASDRDRRIIRARAAELMAAYEAGEDWHAPDHRFHAAIHDATGNPLFGQLIWQIHQAFHDIYDRPFGKSQMGEVTLPLHGPLADAIVAGDAETAVITMARILDLVEQEVRQEMECSDE